MVDFGLQPVQFIGLPSLDIRVMVANIIRAFLSLAGFYLFIQILHGGLKMMTSFGDEEAKAAAIGTIKDGIIGMVIVVSSASIVRFVVDAIANATGIML